MIEPKRRKSQNERIKADLEAGRTITPIDALERHGVLALAQRIRDLRLQGMQITTRIYPELGRFAHYSLSEMN